MLRDFDNKCIVVGVCGGVSAYKAAYLVRELMRHGAKVRVIMTESAQRFISPLTFQALTGEPVVTDIFDEQAQGGMGHIELARFADFFLIAPLTANTLSKMAHGLADDVLTTFYLAFNKPVILCPAMNKHMWTHPAIVNNVSLLKERGHIFIGPSEGMQACGDEGYGRLTEPQDIINVLRVLPAAGLLRGKRVVITAGPTQEAIDPVRYISNHSSGKMGYALAQAAQVALGEVILISGKTALSIPQGIQHQLIGSHQALYDAVMNTIQPGDIFISCAAVSDFSPKETLPHKLKKENTSDYMLALKKNIDILSSVANLGKASYLVGFAAETQDVIDNALKKLHTKKVDMIIANEVGSDKAFNTDDNTVTMITSKESVVLHTQHKMRLAASIISFISQMIRLKDKDM